MTSKGSWETKTLHETCEQSKFQIQKSSNNHKSLFTRHISKSHVNWNFYLMFEFYQTVIQMYHKNVYTPYYVCYTSTQRRLHKRLSGFQLWTSSWEIKTSIIWRLQIYWNWFLSLVTHTCTDTHIHTNTYTLVLTYNFQSVEHQRFCHLLGLMRLNLVHWWDTFLIECLGGK